jgi:murein L,D-transpeptidase YafK
LRSAGSPVLNFKARRLYLAPLLLALPAWALPASTRHHHHHHSAPAAKPHAQAVVAAPLPLPAVTDPEPAAAPAEPEPNPETALMAAVQSLRGGDPQSALEGLQDLVKREPNFHLAQFLYGEVLAQRSGLPDDEPSAAAADPKMEDLLAEYHARLDEALHAPPADALPSSILQLSPEHRYAIVADLPRSRLYVLDNSGGRLHRIRDDYVSIARNGYGKENSGDLRTPVGIYRVVSFTSGPRLPAFYGAGAYPLNYPNSWDRMHGRTGYGIWLHGVPPDTYVRPPRASEGCVVLANGDLVDLKSLIVPGVTPVVLSDQVEWLPAGEIEQRRQDLTSRIESWRERWSARDTDAYLAFYSEDFRTDDGMGRTAFANHKRRVNQSKHNIDVRISDLDLFTYPGEQNLVLAEFTQDYRSDNYDQTTRKEQYWEREADGTWKIVREENREL